MNDDQEFCKACASKAVCFNYGCRDEKPAQDQAELVARVSAAELRDIQSGVGGVPVRGSQWRDDQTIPLYAGAAPSQAAQHEATTLIQACEEGNERESDHWFEITAGEVAGYLDEGYRVRKLYASPVVRAQSEESAPFQQRVQPWMMACFGAEITADRAERNHRFFEESTELVQACGMPRHEAHALVDYVYNRDIGEVPQEIGGVMVTLAALCLAQSQDMHAAGEVELARIWTKVEAIREKQRTKPRGSALPQAVECATGGMLPDEKYLAGAGLPVVGAQQAHAGAEEQDAARYRWLRESWVSWGKDLLGSATPLFKRNTLDEAVDAAIRAAQEGGAAC